MSKVLAGILVGRCLKSMGVDMAFTLVGGPVQGILRGCYDAGIRLIDVRHAGGVI